MLVVFFHWLFRCGELTFPQFVLFMFHHVQVYLTIEDSAY